MFIPKSQLPARPRRARTQVKGEQQLVISGFARPKFSYLHGADSADCNLFEAITASGARHFARALCGLQASRAKSKQRRDLNRISTGPHCGRPGAPNFIRLLPGAVGRVPHERFLAQAEQIVLAHEAQDVHQAVDAPEVSADPPIAIKAIFERDLLGFVAQIRFRPLRRTNFAKSIEAGSTMRCRKPFGSRCSE
ncbi:MAG: hypothetical protein WCB94_05560 [Terriglobales bacterium]